MTTLKFIGKAIYTVAIILLLLWLAVSWVEVVTNNMQAGHDYWNGNFFVLLSQKM